MVAADIGALDAVAEAVHAVHTRYLVCTAGAVHIAEKQADCRVAEKVGHTKAVMADHMTTVMNMKSTTPVLALVVEEERPVAAGREDASCTADAVQAEGSYTKKVVVQCYSSDAKVLD